MTISARDSGDMIRAARRDRRGRMRQEDRRRRGLVRCKRLRRVQEARDRGLGRVSVTCGTAAVPARTGALPAAAPDGLPEGEDGR